MSKKKNLNKEAALQKILSTAGELEQKNDYLTRSDLAFELKDYGVEGDSLQLNDLIREAYERNRSMKSAFDRILSNDKQRPVLEAGRSFELAARSGYESLIDLAKQDLASGGRSIEALTSLISNLAMSSEYGQASSLMRQVVGTAGLDRVKGQAQELFEKYSQVIDYYDNAKGSVLNVISDFSLVRERVAESYRTFASMLTDIFGDSIRAVDPNLFDFDKIEYLDINSMMKHMELAYNKLTTECSQLMSSITDSFKNSLKTALSINNNVPDKRVGLIMAGLTMVSHYFDAHDQTLTMQTELSNMKTSAKRDVSQITADLQRLALIYETIKSIYIPKAELYQKHSGELLETAMRNIAGIVYASPKLQELNARRIARLEELKTLGIEITDIQRSVNYYEGAIAGNKEVIAQLEDEYQMAKDKLPKKPFGIATKKYNRDVYEWNLTCRPLVTRYEDLKVDMRVDDEELQSQKARLQVLEGKKRELQAELRSISRSIKGVLSVDDGIKRDLLPYMDQIIGLLRVGKDVAEAKLDTRLTQAVRMKDLSQMTHEVQQEDTYQKFLADNRHLLNVSHSFAAASVMAVGEEIGYNPRSNVSSQDMNAVAAAQTQVLNKGVDLLRKMRTLERLYKAERLASQEYDREVKRLQKDFDSQFADINTRKEALAQLMNDTSFTQNKDERRKYLLRLSNMDTKGLSADEWEAFLRGDRTITL